MNGDVRAWLDELKAAANKALDAEREAMLAAVVGKPAHTVIVRARYDPLVLECYGKMCMADALYGTLPPGCRELLLKVVSARCENIVKAWREGRA